MARAMWTYWCLVSIVSALLRSCSAQGAGGFNEAVMYRSSYKRIHDAQQKCPVGTTSKLSGSEERPDLSWSISNELSFKQGDWNSSSPDDEFLPYRSAFLDRDLLRLVTLAITDVDDRDAPVKVSAVLSLAKTASESYSQFVVAEEGVQFQPGLSIMTVLMEGVYFQTGKERGLCLVGCTRLADGARSCDVFLELHFPWRLSLRSRRVQGSLRIGDAFKASITSQLGAYTNYVFQNGELVSSACDDHKRNVLPPPSSALYRGNRFCATLMEIASDRWLAVWTSGSSSPFQFDLGGGNRNYQMRILDIRCVDLGNGLGANVSAIFRAVPLNQDPFLATARSGLGNGFAFAAEGIFNPSTGELCMVGCITEDLCNVSVSIFIPLTFSLTQRTSLVGTINSASKFGLVDTYDSFQSLPRELEFEYRYSEVNSLKKKAKEDGAFDSGMRLLKYPVKKPQGSLAQLSKDLSFYSSLIPRPSARNYTALSLEVIAMEDKIVADGEVLNAADTSSSSSSSSSGQFLRMAARINFRSIEPDARTVMPAMPAMSTEGLYIPKTGKAYMAACWPKQSSDQGITNSSSGEGLDCEIDLVIQYPPENVKWLVYPTVAVEINSKRSRDDPLYFDKLKLETYPVLYGDQMKEIAFRKTVEASLSVMTLSLMILCVALQLLYVKRSKTAESVPYISLLMLGVQAFGYSIPLITGMEALFSRLTGSDSSPSPRYRTSESSIHEGELSVVLLYLVKLLSLGAFLLLLRLSQKVVKSRIRLSTKFPSEPRRVPSERKAAAVFFIVHLVGFSVVLLFHYILLAADNVGSNDLLPDSSQLWSAVWWKEMKEYVGLLQDLFLLPQVIAFSAWEKPIRGKPLRRSYYMGLTALRLLPHAYHALSKPWFNPYYAADYALYANPKLDFYNRVGDVLIPLLAVAMAGAVYAQQRWNALCLVKVARTGSNKLLRYGSKLYERLPSSSGPDRLGSFKRVEAELQPTSAAGDEEAA